MELVIIAFMRGVFWSGIVHFVVNFLVALIIKLNNPNCEIKSGSGGGGVMLFVGAICALLKAKALGLI